MSAGKAFRLRTLLVGRTERTEIQVLRSAVAAHLGFWADLATLVVLTEIIGLYYLLSAVSAFAVGLSVTYLLSVLWIFKHRCIKNRFTEFAAFSLIGLIGVMIMLAAMWLLTEVLHLHYLISKIAASVLVFAVNFTMRRLLLFRPQRL